MTYNTNGLTSNNNNTLSAGISIEKVIGLRDKLDNISNQIKMAKKQCNRDKWLKRSHKKNRSKNIDNLKIDTIY